MRRSYFFYTAPVDTTATKKHHISTRRTDWNVRLRVDSLVKALLVMVVGSYFGVCMPYDFPTDTQIHWQFQSTLYVRTMAVDIWRSEWNRDGGYVLVFITCRALPYLCAGERFQLVIHIYSGFAQGVLEITSAVIWKFYVFQIESAKCTCLGECDRIPIVAELTKILTECRLLSFTHWLKFPPILNAKFKVFVSFSIAKIY